MRNKKFLYYVLIIVLMSFNINVFSSLPSNDIDSQGPAKSLQKKYPHDSEQVFTQLESEIFEIEKEIHQMDTFMNDARISRSAEFKEAAKYLKEMIGSLGFENSFLKVDNQEISYISFLEKCTESIFFEKNRNTLQILFKKILNQIRSEPMPFLYGHIVQNIGSIQSCEESIKINQNIKDKLMHEKNKLRDKLMYEKIKSKERQKIKAKLIQRTVKLTQKTVESAAPAGNVDLEEPAKPIKTEITTETDPEKFEKEKMQSENAGSSGTIPVKKTFFSKIFSWFKNIFVTFNI